MIIHSNFHEKRGLQLLVHVREGAVHLFKDFLLLVLPRVVRAGVELEALDDLLRRSEESQHDLRVPHEVNILHLHNSSVGGGPTSLGQCTDCPWQDLLHLL